MRRRAPRKNSDRTLKPTVEGFEKRILLATFTVTNTSDSTATGSLRWAIGQSNGTPNPNGDNLIKFAIAGSGVQSISITSALPTITAPVTIDGTTEPGYTSTPLIELNGAGAGSGTNNSGIDGLDLAAGNSTIKGLAINRFSGNGISLSVAGGNTIENNFLGTDPTGTIAEGNTNDGLLVAAFSNNNLIFKNLASGNTANGIEVNGSVFANGSALTSGNVVAGNLIGTDVTGKHILSNLGDGIYLYTAPNTTIGGSTSASRNIISGNAVGLELYADSDHSVIEGNYIGTDITGEVGLGNSATGSFFKDDILLRGISNSTIGGTLPGEGNVISASANYGIDCFVIGSSNLAIQGNFIGTDATGTKALGSTNSGVLIGGPSNVTIGGTVAGARNIISGNGDCGVTSLFNGAGLTVQGNYIGTDITGTQPLGNGGDGVKATYDGIIVGGLQTGAANLIAYNGGSNPFDQSGVVVTGKDTPVLSNSIHDNYNLGIELQNGANNGIVAPVVTSAVSMNTTSAVAGTLDDPAGSYTLQFFSTPALDRSGKAEGQTLLATVPFTIVGTSGSFALNIPSGFTPGSVISATITDSAGDTSQFSAPITGTGTGNGVGSPTITGISSPASVDAGQTVTETFTITNPDAVADSGVVFVDPIPAGTTYSSGTTSTGALVTFASGQASATIGTLASGQSVTVSIVLTTSPAAVPSFTNVASVETATPPIGFGVDTASVTTTVVPSADLAVTLTTPSGSTPVGDQLTYSLKVTNNGLSDATGVVLTDQLPSGTTYIIATPSSGPSPTVTNGVLTDDYGSLASGGSFTLTLIVLVGFDAFPSATDTASVIGDQQDPITSNNAAQAIADISLLSDVAVVVTPASYVTGAGQPQTYTVTISNNGPSPATDVSLSDQLPTGSTFVSASSSSGPAPTHSPGFVADVIGTINPGASVIVTISIIPAGTAASVLSNTASVTTTASDPDSTNNSVTTVTNIVPAADLAITSVTASPDPILDGQQVSFTIDFVNNGPSEADGATIIDTLPAGLTFVSASVAGGATSDNGSVVTANLANLASGASGVLTIIATTSSVGTFTNTATIASPITDPVSSNNSGSVSFTVSPVVDLAVSLSEDQTTVYTGNILTYTAVITNNGPSTATGVVLTDDEFPGAFVLSSEVNNVFGVEVNGVLSQPVGTIAAGASVTIILTVSPSVTGTFTNTVNVTSTGTDSNPSNNTASLGVTVIAPYQTISFAATSYPVVETAGFATITLTRSGDTAGDVTVHFSTTGGIATPGLDYQPVSTIVDFPAGATTATVDVPVIANPYDNHDELVNLQLDSPTGGALLLAPGQAAGTSPITSVLDIVDTDPVTVGPTVTDLKLIGLVSEIIAIEVDTTGNLNPITAGYTGNYSIIALGGGGKGGFAAGTVVPVVTAAYNASTGAVVLVPAVALPANELFEVAINGLGAGAVSDRAGNPLNSVLNVTPGSDYILDVARGTNLTYTDQNGTAVNIKLTGPGTLDLDRSVSGDFERLQVVGAVAKKTVVTGKVFGPRTTLNTILGLGEFGAIHFNLTTPAFYVVHTVYPSTDELTDPDAVDTLLTPPPVPTPTPVKKTTRTVKVTKAPKPKATVKAQSIAITTPTPTEQALDFVPTAPSTVASKHVTTAHPHAATARVFQTRKAR